MEEEGREDTVGEEVLYEIRQHAKGTLYPASSLSTIQAGGDTSSSSSSSPSPSPSGGGFLSYLTVPGVSRLKDRWSGYKLRERRSRGRMMSLFVSPEGEYVAVTAGNHIVFLRKDDDYTEPCGLFMSNDRQTVFNNGSWSERQGIFGVVDNIGTLYFIKSNGEEISRRTRSQLKLSSPIIGLIVRDGPKIERSCSCEFFILTSEGLLYHVDVTQESNAYLHLIPSSNYLKQKAQSPPDVSCLDFSPGLSLLVLVCPSTVPLNSGDFTGLFSLYLLRLATNTSLELIFSSPQFEGLFSTAKGYASFLTYPKVAISPQGRYIATLDLTGCIDIFNLDCENNSLSCLSSAEWKYQNKSSNLVSGKKNVLNEIVDFSWWTDHILIIAKGTGSITMYNILSGAEVIEKNPSFSIPVMGRVGHRQEHVFVLDGTKSGEGFLMAQRVEDSNIHHSGEDSSANNNQLDTGRLHWNLMSFSGRSALDMYNILISNHHYQSALEFANRYKLHKDDVFKAQWLHSNQEINEINSFLSEIKDQMFVLSECVDKVGPTEEAVRFLLSYGLSITDQYKFLDSDDWDSNYIWDFRMFRLQLLQYKDMLETFVGINMGRFSAQEYIKFRNMPLTEVATTLAENGKIGSLNLLFKRHPYSLSPSILEILSAIPETVPVQSYDQLLPGTSPPSTLVLRNEDWVECDKTISFISRLSSKSKKVIDVQTENILKKSVGFVWPSSTELTEWYRVRAKDIDNMSGQLDNCLCLVEIACRKGLVELKLFLEVISYLHQLIYSDGYEKDPAMDLITWEQLSNYEKFKIMLKGVNVETVVERLQQKAIPFMQSRLCSKPLSSANQMKEDQSVHNEAGDSFLVRWLKEMSADNKLDICLAVIENACEDSPIDGLFKDEGELIETTLQCIYSCTLTNQWNIIASILSKLPQKFLIDKSGMEEFHGDCLSQHSQEFNDYSNNNFVKLEKRIKVAEGHVEVGRLLAYYQVPKPMNFFLGAHLDERNVKQLLRLVLSKFGRRQPGRSDNDWANMWRDMQCFQEKAFHFLDTEYMLVEFCRGLLKAGKFSLARNYLKGVGAIELPTEKIENLVIQAAREYFFSASTLDCTEIWKAKECLTLFPNSKNVQAEADTIEALTIRLPNFGITLLPLEFRQIRNPMEIINMAISSHAGAYLDVEELLEIAKLLGLNSADDIAAVEEAVAREAAVAGDMQLAFDLCLVLAKKGHGPIWDLCAAIARGPHLDNMDTNSRKQLLGFALSHCDEDSIGELLHAWKDVDAHIQYEQLMTSTGSCPPNFSIHGSSLIPLPIHSIENIFDLRESIEPLKFPFRGNGDRDQIHFGKIKEMLSKVVKDMPTENGASWDSLLRDHRKFLLFSALELPWLLELSEKEEYGKKAIPVPNASVRKYSFSIQSQAFMSILGWLAGNDIAPDDNLISCLAKSIMDPPVSEDDDVLGCLFLLNLLDAFHGGEIIEEKLKQREEYQEIISIMNIGMTYSSLQNSNKECSSPEERRKLLLHRFHQKQAPFTSDDTEQIDKAQSTFWKEWKTKLEEQRQLAEEARALEQSIPWVDSARFLSRDTEYINDVVFSFIDSIKMDKKHILKEAVKLADSYGMNRTEVLLRFFGNALVSDHWGNDDILAEISVFRDEIVGCAKGVIDIICSVVYPAIDGHNKQRLSYIYSILSACYQRLRTEEPSFAAKYSQGHKHILEPFQFSKILEQECRKISFIDGLNFKNIAGLHDLNFEHFREEISNNIHESTVEALASMVQTFESVYDNPKPEGLMSWKDIYNNYVVGLFALLEREIDSRSESSDSINSYELQNRLGKIDLSYSACKKHIRALTEADKLDMIWRYFMLCIPSNLSWSSLHESTWKDCLVILLNFWIKVAVDVQENEIDESSWDKLSCTRMGSLSRCFMALKGLVVEGEISISQGWNTVFSYSKHCLTGNSISNISDFLKAMIFSGCGYGKITRVYFEAEIKPSVSSGGKSNNLLDLYLSLMDAKLVELSSGSEENQDLQHLLSSLSSLQGNHIEDLNMIRHEVWRKLSSFSENMQLASCMRVYALELMQSLTGKKIRDLSGKFAMEVEPWEAWDELYGEKSSVTAEQADASSSIMNTLVALKSTRLVETISPDMKITPEDLMTLDSAVSCFLRLCETASTKENIDVLQAVLNEWQELFSSNAEKEKSSESHDELNNWSGDEWDEGWESLSEEAVVKDAKQGPSGPVCPLHTCWTEIIKRLVGLSEFPAVMTLLDRSMSKPDVVLLDEDEAQGLFHLGSDVDCFIALKMLLLLPYDGPRFQCLHAVEAKLREGSFSGHADDYELLILVLSSGMLEVIVSDTAFRKLLSYLCYLVGHLARRYQEDMLKCSRNGSTNRSSQNVSTLFGRILLPYFISELVKAGQYTLAGFIVSQWMHIPASLSLMDIVEVSLRWFLEGQVQQSKLSGDGGKEIGVAEVSFSGPLVNTVSSLKGKLGSMLQYALSTLPVDASN